LPPGFERPSNSPKTWRTHLRKLITDKNVTPHSGRHFFIQTSRRAGCDSQVIAAICGHGSTVGSSTQRGYGEFTDDVLIREAEKVWNYVYSRILKNV
jgi:integrase